MIKWTFAVVSLAFLSLNGCGDRSASGPANALSSGVVWGVDDRRDVPQDLESMDMLLRYQAQATVSLVRKNKVDHYTRDAVVFRPLALNSSGKYCPEVKFGKQQDISHCSGILITPTRLLTAGHCVKSQEDCESQLFVFNRRDPGSRKALKSDVYKCKKVLARRYEQGNLYMPDIAVVELDRVVGGGVIPNDVVDAKFEVGEEIRLLGYSMGVSLKKHEAKILSQDTDLYYRTDLDAFEGDSGAPVFSVKTGSLKGLLIGGAPDFVEDLDRNCLKVNVCNERTCLGEKVLHIGEAAKIINGQ